MTKLQLLKIISETDIIKHYVPTFKPDKKQNYKSPFSAKDDKPSLSFYRKGSNWLFKSQNTGHQGDIFQFVADLKKIDCKTHFPLVIESIEKDLKLNGYAVKAANNVPSETIADKKKSISISYEKSYTSAFVDYFAKFKISIETLSRFMVYQVNFHHFVSSEGKNCKFDYKKSNKLAVCYNVNKRIKIYFPEIAGLQKKAFGFKDQTKEDVFGLAQLEELVKQTGKKAPSLYIAAGEKDCLAFNSNGFPSISFQSETTRPDKKVQEKINTLAEKIIIVYDNDDAGMGNAEILSAETGWGVLALPKEFKDTAKFFEVKTKEDFQKLLTETKASKKVTPEKDDFDIDNYTIFHKAENWLSKKYKLRFNSIKLEIEIAPIDSDTFKQINENSLYVEMNKSGVRIGMDKLICIIKSDFVEHYNPLIHYFKNLPKWDGKTDHITELCSYIHCVEQEQFGIQFSKWMMRAVKCATVEGYYNKQAFILVHNKQNSGKTTFCRFLCPPALAEYFAENISDDKDSRIAIAKNFLINLDELSSLHRSEINSLKSLFSKDIINERLPYDRKSSIIHRVASFIGSTNLAEFLTDETGSVRWLCFDVKHIDWAYKKKIDINKCWAQAVGMIKEGLHFDMNKEEIEENELRNSKFQQLSVEAELIPNFFVPSKESEAGAVFMSSTDILTHLAANTTVRLNRVMIGRAMPLCGFIRCKDSVTDRYGYWVKHLRT